MKIYEYPITEGRLLNGDTYTINSRSKIMIESGAAPYVVYVNNEFWSTCETYREACEEVNTMERGRIICTL